MEEGVNRKGKNAKPTKAKRMKEELDQNKEYEWFLSDISYKTINGRLMAVMDWSNKDAKVTAREFLVIPDNHVDSRIFKLMQTLGYAEKPDTIPDPRKFFERSTRIIAKPLRYYAEFNSEVWKWKLNYATIRAVNGNTASLPEDELNRLKMLVSKQDNYQEAIKKVAAIKPEWMPAFLKLVEAGEAKYAKVQG